MNYVYKKEVIIITIRLSDFMYKEVNSILNPIIIMPIVAYLSSLTYNNTHMFANLAQQLMPQISFIGVRRKLVYNYLYTIWQYI